MTIKTTKCSVCNKDKFKRELIDGELYTGELLEAKSSFGIETAKFNVDILPTTGEICKDCVFKERLLTTGVYCLILIGGIVLLLFGMFDVFGKIEWMGNVGFVLIIAGISKSIQMFFFKSDEYYADMSIVNLLKSKKGKSVFTREDYDKLH